MKLFLILALIMPFCAFPQSRQKKKIVYEYKKYEKFDFDEIGVEGDSGTPGDISVAPTPRKNYRNRLPERKDFSKEMRKSASGIR